MNKKQFDELKVLHKALNEKLNEYRAENDPNFGYLTLMKATSGNDESKYVRHISCGGDPRAVVYLMVKEGIENSTFKNMIITAAVALDASFNAEIVKQKCEELRLLLG